MITDIIIKNFKKFESISVHDLSQVNCVIGVNNVGKTSFLEGVLGLACGTKIESFLNLAVFRRFPQAQNINNPYLIAELLYNSFHHSGNHSNSKFDFSFECKKDRELYKFHHNFEPGSIFNFYDKNILMLPENNEPVIKVPVKVIDGVNLFMDSPKRYIGEWTVSSHEGLSQTLSQTVQCKLHTPFQTVQFPDCAIFYVATIHDFFTYRDEQGISRVYSHLIRSNKIDLFIEEINKSFSNNKIKDVQNIPFPDGSQGFITVQFEDGNRCPIYALGDGFRRWYEILGEMVVNPNSIHCIEEADATLHYEAQKGFSINIVKLAKEYNNQIFLTSHNVEFLKTFLQSIREKNEDELKNGVRVITLRDFSEKTKSRTLDGKEALDAMERGLELRK